MPLTGRQVWGEGCLDGVLGRGTATRQMRLYLRDGFAVLVGVWHLQLLRQCKGAAEMLRCALPITLIFQHVAKVEDVPSNARPVTKVLKYFGRLPESRFRLLRLPALLVN